MPLSKIPAVGVDATGTPSSSTFFRGDNTWATPAASGLGIGQTWQDVKTTPGRVLGTTYTNSTGKPIFVVIASYGSVSGSSSSLTIVVNGVTIGMQGLIYGAGGIGSGPCISFIVPDGNTYSATTSQGILQYWTELR